MSLFESSLPWFPLSFCVPPLWVRGLLGFPWLRVARCWASRGGRFPVFWLSFGGVPCLLFLLLLLCLVLCVPFLLLLFGCCRSCGLVPVLPLLALPSVPMVGLVSSVWLVLRRLRLVRCAVRCFSLVTLALWFALWLLVLTRLTSGSAVSFEAADSPASGLPFGSPVSVTVNRQHTVGGVI